MNPVRLIVMMWLAAVFIVTYGHYRNGGTSIPPASGYFGSAVTYSLLSGMAQIPQLGPLAGVFAVAFTYSLYIRVSHTGPGAAAAGGHHHQQPHTRTTSPKGATA